MSLPRRPSVFWTILLLALSQAWRLRADDSATTYTLAYKFQAGQDLRWKAEHRAVIKTTVRGTTQTAQSQTLSGKRWHIPAVTPEGIATLVNYTDFVKMSNEISGRQKAEYDSRVEPTAPSGFEDAARAIGVPLTEVEIDPQGKVLKRIEKLAQIKGNFTPPITIPLPAKPIAIGGTWDETHKITVELKDKLRKAIDVRRRFTLKGIEGELAVIGVEFQTLTPTADPAIEAQLIQHCTEGEIRFHIAQGRIESQHITLDKRVLGFAGPASSMHYQMELTETLATGNPQVATRPK